MDGINQVYDRVLSGYIVTDIFIHNDFPDTYFGKDLDHTTYKRLKEDEKFLVQTLKEIVGTFMRNGKISDTFWVHDKIFIGDEGICLLGEILTICQIVAYIDSDDLDISEIEPNELFKKALVRELKEQNKEDITLEEDKLKKEGNDIRVNFSEDTDFKYICVLLSNGGRQQVRVLRFNKYCGNSIKLLSTLKGTIHFLNDLRALFRDFRAQVVLKDKLRREFFAYLNFRKTEPNFRGSKIVFEFFNSLHSKAIQPLFVGLNEHYLSLLEEAISYCPIVTYAFYKNIYMLKNIDINAPRRTWKVVCNLQKLYRHMKRVKEQMAETGDDCSSKLDEMTKKTNDDELMSNGRNVKNLSDVIDFNRTSDHNNRTLKEGNTSIGALTAFNFGDEDEEEEEGENEAGEESDDDKGKEKGKKKKKKKKKEKDTNTNTNKNENENEEGNEQIVKATDENISHREKCMEDARSNMIKLFKTYGGQCRIGKVHGRCEDATFQTDFPPAFGIFDGVGSWSLEGIDASKFSIGLALACQREAEKLSKNLDGYAQLSHNTIVRSKLLLKNSHLSVKNDYTEAYGSSTAIVGIIDEYTGKCGVASLGDSVCMILRREFLPENINFERESYPKFPGESFLYFNEKGRNPSIIRKIIWKTTDQKWENGAPYQLSNLPGREEWKDLEKRGYHSFVKILEKVDIDGDSPDMAISPASEILCMPGDLILLMSDGVSDNLFDEEIEAYCTFAISPEEACELGDPSLFTPAQDVAYAITNIAKRRSGDKLHHRPFLPFAGGYKEQNQVYKGSKVDDISCVAVWVVCENEESVKNLVKYPDRPSTLATDKYYNNSILYAFNEMSKLCTPSKAFVKNKDKIERINLEYTPSMVNIIPQYQHYQGEISTGMMKESLMNTGNSQFRSNNVCMQPHPGGGIFTFDSMETPIKFGNSKKSKDECEDLSDIILQENDNEDLSHDENEDSISQDYEKKGKNDEEKKNKKQKEFSNSFHDEYLNRTPEPLQGGAFHTNLNDEIGHVGKIYMNSPPVFSAESSKINQRNLKNVTTASINEAVQKAQFLQSLNYETPVKEIKRIGKSNTTSSNTINNNNANTNNNNNNNIGNVSNSSNSSDSMAASLAEAKFKEQMRMEHETPIKMDKKYIKNSKRKSIFADNLETPTKSKYAPKRSKRS